MGEGERDEWGRKGSIDNRGGSEGGSGREGCLDFVDLLVLCVKRIEGKCRDLFN